MPRTKTCDPNTEIEKLGVGYVIYIVPATGERWKIVGTCNQCGACWKNAVGDKPLLDCPVRPEIKDDFPDCTLSGEYLPKAE